MRHEEGKENNKSEISPTSGFFMLMEVNMECDILVYFKFPQLVYRDKCLYMYQLSTNTCLRNLLSSQEPSENSIDSEI